ncbi:MAG: hypothetical protein ABJO02_10005 [Reichenbachiella sp.]|uniref:hypothetical protein n=1 Tax=Reichenbachiella sp. TaxID=2184521 RepID=UPI0032998C1E
MNKTKSILLFLTLIFPVLIYLFLQGFGKNEFDIPVYYEGGITAPLGDCPQRTSNRPYQLNGADLQEILKGSESASQVAVYELGNKDNEQLRNNLYTFLEKYKDRSDINLISVKQLDDTLFSSSRYPSWKRFNLPDSDLMRLGKCILQLNLNAQMKADSGLVLVDENRRIRGYYDPYELKEIDRLNTELYILLSKQNSKQLNKDER